MARPIKEGIDFSGWDVGLLDNDEKIDALIDSQGIGAFTVYFYLCQKAYATHGYYIEWGYASCATIARRLGSGASAGYVKNVVEMCFQCGLFDKRLFELCGILTSRGIQKRYLVAVGRRTKRRGETGIIEKYCLLEKEEIEEALVSVAKNRVMVYQNPVMVDQNPIKVKESKYTTTTTAREAQNETEFSEIDEKPTLEAVISYFSEKQYTDCNPERFYLFNQIKNPTFEKWREYADLWANRQKDRLSAKIPKKDSGTKKQKEIGFDLDEFFDAATKRNS